MKYLFLILVSFNLYAKFPITNGILKVCPQLTWKESHQYALMIYKYSKKYKIDWKILVAIFRQESICGLKLRNGCETGYVKLNNKWEKIEICQDFGMFNINKINIEEYNLDIDKLDSDFNYNMQWVVKFLSRLKNKYKASDPIWYCRFHSHTSHLKYKYCDALHKHINNIGVKNEKK